MKGIKELFRRKWPRMEEMEPEKDAKRRALKGLRLKEEEALELVTVIGDPSGLLIEGMRENLPEAIQRLVLNDSHDTWQEFYDSLTKIKIPAIERAQWDAEAMSRFTRLADILENSQQPTTWSPQYHGHIAPMPAPTRMLLSGTPTTPKTLGFRPPTTPLTLQTNTGTPRGPPATPMAPATVRQQYNVGNPTATPSNQFYALQQTPGPPTPSYRLKAINFNIWRPFIVTPAGQKAYERVVAEWRHKHGGMRVTISNPFPLCPGGASLDEWECFQCGKKGHIGAVCTEPEDHRVPLEERNCHIANKTTSQVASIEEVQEEQGNGEELSQ
ncbi:hypothetical protein M422DRAFT_45435 [Sphaerobolus stellatus SS14]|nr:hypothetical protein M422DRAFT_45435 [Sphaerobolus stellatus SS14]